MKVDVYNLKNEKVGIMDVPDYMFNSEWKPVLVKQVIDAQLANKRKPLAHAKDRSEVRGGGRKPWRQKGTGRARHGSIRSPIWIGGGKAHGPVKMKDYSKKVNKKMKRLALFSSLSKKTKDGEVKFLENLEVEEPKTKILFGYLSKIVDLPKGSKRFDLLIIPDVDSKNIFRAASNLEKTKVLNPTSLNVYDILNFKHIFIDKRAIDLMSDVYKI